MAESAGAVTQQPRSKKRELEEFVRDLDPTQVSGMDMHMEKHVFLRMILLRVQLASCFVYELTFLFAGFFFKNGPSMMSWRNTYVPSTWNILLSRSQRTGSMEPY